MSDAWTWGSIRPVRPARRARRSVGVVTDARAFVAPHHGEGGVQDDDSRGSYGVLGDPLDPVTVGQLAGVGGQPAGVEQPEAERVGHVDRIAEPVVRIEQ